MEGFEGLTVSGLKISFEKVKSNQCIVRIQGELAGEEVLRVQDSVMDALRQNSKGEFVLDFEDVDYLDSAGIGLIFDLAQTAQDERTRVSVVNAKDEIKKVLRVTKVDEIVKVY